MNALHWDVDPSKAMAEAVEREIADLADWLYPRLIPEQLSPESLRRRWAAHYPASRRVAASSANARRLSAPMSRPTDST